jgi:lipoprotein-releasing system permease protein
MRSFSGFIATKYLISIKRWTFVHWLSLFSFLGVMVGSAALITIMSVFNGLEGYVAGMFGKLDPDLEITQKSGKFFEISSEKFTKITQIPGVVSVQRVLEENALLRYGKYEDLARLKGVSSDFSSVLPRDVDGFPTMLAEGRFPAQDQSEILLGCGLANRLGVDLRDFTQKVRIYLPKRGGIDLSNPESSFQTVTLIPSGIFEVEPEMDQQYAIVPIHLLRDLLNVPFGMTQCEIFLHENADERTIKAQISQILGNDYFVRNRFEQQETLFQIFRLEKWVGVMILAFIIFIASLGLIGAIRLLVIEKKRDTYLFQAIGANSSQVRSVFIRYGLNLVLSATLVGCLIGSLIVFGQQWQGWIVLSETQQIPYPVSWQYTDVLFVMMFSPILGWLFSYFSVPKKF